MRPVEIIAAGAVSALGRGAAAYAFGGPGQKPRCAADHDAELAAAGLGRTRAARAAGLEQSGPRRAERLLELAFSDLQADLERALPDWRSCTIGLALGTSAGGVSSQVECFAELDRRQPLAAELAAGAPYFGPLRALGDSVARFEPMTQVLAACASSTLALGVGCRWLDAGHVDLVIAGGYDALSTFVAAGFEALGAVSAGVPRPFRKGRDGMVLGEGAALLALVRAGRNAPRPRSYGFILGFGCTSDAVHVTAPDRSGRGLSDAARSALADAGLRPEDVQLVSAHATATPYNDAAEARVLEALFGQRAPEVVVHPYKAVIGHTLGAAGALELLAALAALRERVLPAAVGEGTLDPAFHARILDEPRPAPSGSLACLKLSAAFGGTNVALVASPEPGPGATREPWDVALLALGGAVSSLDPEQVAGRLRLPPERLARLDALSALALAAALAALQDYDGELPERTGVVLGSAAATVELNELYDRRRRTRGARFVEPRRFPATSPNLAPGQVSIALGLRGPTLAVAGGRDPAAEALLVAYDLIAAGDAPALFVIAAEHSGPTVEALWGAAGWPVPRTGATAVLLGRSSGAQRLERARLAQHRRPAAPWPAHGPRLLELVRAATEVTSLPG